jgi:hypothetical protein
MEFETYIGDCTVEVEAQVGECRAKIISLTINGLEFSVEALSAKTLHRIEDEADRKVME